MKEKFTSVLLSALVLAAPLTAIAAENESNGFDGYIYLTAERTTLGQGLIREPEKVGYYKDENLTQIVKRYLGDSAVFSGSDQYAYLKAIKDGGEPKDWTEDSVPFDIYSYVEDYIDKRAEADTLAAEDYTPYSGYMFTIDNVSMSTYSSAVVLGDDSKSGANYKDGSVVRIMYSIYGWGFDVGLGYEGMGFKWESDNTFADRSELIKRVADIKAEGLTEKYGEDYTDAVELLASWDPTEEDMNSQLDFLADEDPDETDPDETEPASETQTTATEPASETETKATEPSVTEPASETETKATEPSVTEPASETETKATEPSVTEPASETETKATEPVSETEPTPTNIPVATTATEVQPTTQTVAELVKAQKLTLNVSKKTLNAGKSFKLKAKVTPSNATNKKVSFTVSNKKLASVNSAGTVKAKAKGTTYVIVKTKDGSNLSAKCKLTIKQPVKKITVKLGSKTVNNKTVTLKKGQKITLKANISPSNANKKTVKWTVKNKRIAKVSKGVVTAKAKGTTAVTVKANDGSKVSAKLNIKVK